MDLKTYLLPAVLCLPLAAAGQGVYPQCLRLVQDTWQLMAFIQVCDEKSLPSDAVLENVAEQMGKQIEICDRQLDEAAQKRLQHDLSTYLERQQSRGIDENAVRRQCSNIDRTLDDMLKRYQSQTQGVRNSTGRL